MKFGLAAASLWVVVFLFLAGCATPRQVGAPSAAPASAPPPDVVAPGRAPAATPEEAAWAKIVEAARKESRVTLYSYSFVGDIGLALQRAFNEKYGIRVDIVTGRGAEFLERLKTEQRMGNMTADFMDGSPTHLTSAKTAGLTMEAASSLPVLQERQVWFVQPLEFHDPGGHILPHNFFLYSPFVNTRLLKPEGYPKAWKDLLAPQWKGKMMIPEPKLSTGSYLTFVPLVNRQVLGWDYVEALGKQDLRLSTGAVQEMGWLAKGERELSISQNASTMASYIAEGAPIQAIPIEEGMIAGGLAAVLTKGAPHPNAGRVFLNWLLSREGQQILAKASSSGSIRKDVDDHTPAAARVSAKRIIVPTPQDLEQQSKLFREGFISKMWQQK